MAHTRILNRRRMRRRLTLLAAAVTAGCLLASPASAAGTDDAPATTAEAAGSPAVPVPTVTGPVASDLDAPDNDRTFFGTDLDIADRGYVEEEYFYSGKANVYDATVAGAFGAEYSFEYYEGLLGGANFYDHGPNREGTVETVNRRDVSTADLPREWTFTDEWYNLTPYPSFVNVLAEVDAETSIRPEGTQGHPGHGKHHPVSWCHYYDGGRAWLTTLGHDVKAWTDEPLRGDIEFKEHVVQGTLSAMGVEEFCQ